MTEASQNPPNGFDKGEQAVFDCERVDVERVIRKDLKERFSQGSFALTNKKVIWTSPEAKPFHVPYGLIQAHQESKKDFRIRLVLKEPVDGAAVYVFTFDTEDHQERAKNLIMKKLTSLKLKATEPKDAAPSFEIEIRKKVLINNPELRKIHKALVIDKQFLDEEEFWSLHKNLISQEEEKVQQQRGPSNQLLADVRATTEGQSGSIGFKIDSKVTESIFRLFPGVKRSYEEYVPDKISREKFWSIYFQADFFYRKSEKSTAQTEDIHMFERYQRELEEKIRASKKQRVDTGVLTDLSRTEENVPESFLRRLDSSMQSGVIHKTFQVANRLHHHANIVLHPEVTESQPFLLHAETPESKDLNLAVVLDDLQPAEAPASIPLKIADEKQYFESQLTIDDKGGKKSPGIDNAKLKDGLQRIERWEPTLNTSFLKTKHAVEILGKLFPVGEVVANSKAQEAIDEDVRTLNLKLSELLRFFWMKRGDLQRTQKLASRLQEQRDELVSLREVREAGTSTYEMISAMISVIDKTLSSVQ